MATRRRGMVGGLEAISTHLGKSIGINPGLVVDINRTHSGSIESNLLDRARTGLGLPTNFQRRGFTYEWYVSGRDENDRPNYAYSQFSRPTVATNLLTSYMNQIGADSVTINEIVGDSGIGFTGFYKEMGGAESVFDLGIDELKDVTSLSFNFGGGKFAFEGTAAELTSLQNYTNFMDLEGFLNRENLFDLPDSEGRKIHNAEEVTKAKEQSEADAARAQNYIRGRIAAERSTLKAIHMSNQLQGTYI